MAVMKATRTLRDAPGGASLDILAVAGARVRILEASPPWTKIELMDSDLSPKPQGWVSAQAVDAAADTLGPLDKSVFAAECIFQAKTFRVLPHYVMSIANMRTNVTDGPNANGIDHGPFALSPNEWTVFGSLAEFDMNMSQANFQNWTAQCLVFSAMCNVMQRRLATLLANQPSAAQMALAQMIGTHAAAACVQMPDRLVADSLAAVAPPDLATDAIEPARLPARYDAFLTSKTGKQALEAVAEALQKSLDETRPLIEVADATFVAFADELLQQITPSSAFTKAEVLPGKTVRYTAADGSTLTKKDGSIAWRHNNPGNIRNGNFATANGAIAEGPGFAIFPSESTGFQAILSLLSGPSYRDRTLAGAIERYAPSSDNNNTAAYIAFVTSTTGIPTTKVLNTLTAAEMTSFAKAIQKHEGWTPGAEIRTAATLSSGSGVSVEAIVRSALHEWEHWGRSRPGNIGKTETSDGFAEYVYENYFRAVVQNPSESLRAERIRKVRNNEYAWSAIAISGMMKNAGYTKQQFNFAESHSRYIRDAIAARRNDDRSAHFWGFRIGEPDSGPVVGDLIGYARGNNNTSVSHAAAQAWFDKTDGYNSHTDIVVAVRSGEIDVIGGNVSNSVTMKTVKIDPVSGLLTDTDHPWFVVMKRRLSV